MGSARAKEAAVLDVGPEAKGVQGILGDAAEAQAVEGTEVLVLRAERFRG